MKARTVTFSVLTFAVLSFAFGYAYHLGYSHGSAEEKRHWLVSYRDGVWTAHENPAYPIFKRGHAVIVGAPMVNSIPASYSH